MKRISISFFVILALLIAPASSVLVSYNASAVSKTSSDTDKINAYFYGGWLISCFWSGGKYSVDTANTNGESVATGVVGSGASMATGITPNMKACNDSSFFGAAIKSMGIPWSTQDVLNFMCDTILATRTGNCKDSNNAATFAVSNLGAATGNNVRQLFIKQAGYDFFSDFEKSKLLQYEYFSMMALSNQIDGEDACKTDTSKEQTIAANNVMSIKQIQSDGTVTTHKYTYDEQGFIDVRFGGGPLGFPNGYLCSEAVNRVNQLAGDPAVQQAYKISAQAGTAVQAGTSAGGGSQQGGSTGPGKSTCAVDGVGWIVCPVMNFLGARMDDLVKFLGDNFLRTDPELLKADANNGTFVAWGVFRNYANIAFIFVFLFIIFSQVSGMGLSNYGLKKMLPKLIVSAILVNISYYICQAAVDATNMLGYSITEIFNGIAQSTVSGSPTIDLGSGGWGDAVGGVLVGTIGIGLALALGILIPALLAVLVVVFILLIRKVIIILLIIVSPFAFVAYLLPNTEEWFKKWYTMFGKLLMVFPVVAALFGAGKLASTILHNIGATADSATSTTVLNFAALGTAVVPLILLPGALKGALAATGKFGQKMQGWGDKSTGWAGKRAKSGAAATAVGNAWKYRQGAKKQRRANSIAGNRVSRAVLGRVGGKNYAGRLQNQAGAAEHQEYEDAVKLANDAAIHSNMAHDDRLNAARTGLDAKGKKLSDAERDAHVRYAMSAGSFDERNKVLNQAGGMTPSQKRSVVSGARAKGDDKIYGNPALGAIEAKDFAGDAKAVLEEGTVDQLNKGAVGADVATRDAKTAKYLADQAKNATPYSAQKLRESIDAYLASPEGAKVTAEVRNQTNNIGVSQSTIDSAHEEALVQNALYDMHNRNNPPSNPSPPGAGTP